MTSFEAWVPPQVGSGELASGSSQKSDRSAKPRRSLRRGSYAYCEGTGTFLDVGEGLEQGIGKW